MSSPEELPTSAQADDRPYWHYALPAFMLALLGIAAVRRRRRPVAESEPLLAAEVSPAPPRPLPVPRPWLQAELKAERTTLTKDEAEVAFVLTVRNTGKSAARNVRINARMFNAGAEQDKEIGIFFRTRGAERRTIELPELDPDGECVIQGSVALGQDELRTVNVQNTPLFIPVIGVNVMYDWGESRVGQTSKSYLVGREVAGPDGKMGAFRTDRGPRVWRSVGQRQHRLARRV